MLAVFTSSILASETTRRSARRATVRARWQRAALSDPRQDEIFQRRQVFVEAVKILLQLVDVGFRDHRVAGHTQLTAKVEQLVLQAREAGADVVRHVGGQQQPQHGIELIHCAVALNPQSILVDTPAIAEAGLAGVAGTGINF